MAMNFPDNPVVGDIFTSAGRSWRWDGSVWASIYTSDTIDGGTA